MIVFVCCSMLQATLSGKNNDVSAFPAIVRQNLRKNFAVTTPTQLATSMSTPTVQPLLQSPQKTGETRLVQPKASLLGLEIELEYTVYQDQTLGAAEHLSADTANKQ